MPGWALDLGTTNTVVARWDAARDAAVAVTLGEREHPGIPTALRWAPDHEPHGLGGRLRRWLGRGGAPAQIGQDALDTSSGMLVRGFKRALWRDPRYPVARRAGRVLTASSAAELFLRGLFTQLGERSPTPDGEWWVTVPVHAGERYRATVHRAMRRAGAKGVRFVDEPVAAALGYGVEVHRHGMVLVVDFGGGSLDLALVALDANSLVSGRAQVVAKTGRPIGGDLVDAWILESVVDQAGIDPQALAREDGAFWRGNMLAEARRVKEATARGEASFAALPPEDLRHYPARIQGEARAIPWTASDVGALIRQRGLFDVLEDALNALPLDVVDDVVLTGGSSLLPGFREALAERFGAERVCGWRPFTAVATGAAALSVGRTAAEDFIVHAYALQVHDRDTAEPGFETIIAPGTRYPTAPDHWHRRLVPTCALGEPERVFELRVFELEDHVEGAYRWDAQGHRLDHADGGIRAIPLNGDDPMLGKLNPPHEPRDRSPRLDVQLGVDADRWLVAQVRDLKTDRWIAQDRRVVRLR